MEILSSATNGVLTSTGPLIVLLGLLIFVHELGHFLVAKYFNVRVEVFSLGFGPKLLKYKHGDTTYALSAIPLGGYVKMYGDDPSAEVPAESRAVSFYHKPVSQRIWIVLGGPLMNFFFAILVYFVVAFVGQQHLQPVLGDIDNTTKAFEVGFRSNDRIVNVDGKAVSTWDEVQKTIESRADKTVTFSVQRKNGESAEVSASPVLVKNRNVMSWDREVGEVAGLSISALASVIAVPDPTSALGAAGVRTAERIAAIGDTKIERWSEMVPELERAVANESSINLKIVNLIETENEKEVERTVSIPVKPEWKKFQGDALVNALGAERGELYLGAVEKDTPAYNAGLRKGDRIESVNGKSVASFLDVASAVRTFDSKNPTPVQFVVLRDGKKETFAVTPRIRERLTLQGKSEEKPEVGIRPLLVDAMPETTLVRTSNPIEAFGMALEQTQKWTSLTVLSLVRLVQAEVSPKSVGSLISIGQMAKRSWQVGLSAFLNVMAIISINLFIFNLLPVPVLDGGHLVFYTIEALRGAPLSLRKLELAQQVGVILLLGLMVFALFNDVSRWLGQF